MLNQNHMRASASESNAAQIEGSSVLIGGRAEVSGAARTVYRAAPAR